MSQDAPQDGDATPRRSPELVIADYLVQFRQPDQSSTTPGPDAVGLIHWLRDEGWEIRPALGL